MVGCFLVDEYGLQVIENRGQIINKGGEKKMLVLMR